jgi:A118 family predicted phage portal protein
MENTAAQDRIEALMDDGLQATLLEGGEVCAGLGGAYMRVVWDDKLRDRAWLDIVHADCAVPTFFCGQLISVIFWRVLEIDGGTFIRHLECREPGLITHGVYKGTQDKIGTLRPLTDFEQTKDFAESLTLPGNVMTAEYIPNYRPARSWRNIPSAAYWGQSDYQGVTGLMDALDEVYASWMRDIRLAKGRIIVPNAYLQSSGPGKGSAFAEDKEVYAGLDMLVRADANGGLTLNQFAIRVAEHRDTSTALIEQIVRQAGYSAATFGEVADGQAVTATEIRSRERRSMVTRSRKGLYWRPALRNITQALMVVEQFLFSSGVEPELPDVEFQDSISEDPQTLATTASLLRTAEAASTETLVRLVNSDWDDEKVNAEVARITKENVPPPMADPTLIGADTGPPAPPGNQQDPSQQDA